MEAITRSSGINHFQPVSAHQHQRERQSTAVTGDQHQAAKQTNAQRGNTDELTPKEKKQVQELKKRDREVRQHEQAHKIAAGAYAVSGPSYNFQRGSDGKSYAVGGEVKLDTGPVPNDPEATIRKAQVIRRAALAPQDPSAQDRRVAGQASAMERETRIELRKEQQGETPEGEIQPANSTQGPNTPESVPPGSLINLLA
ncbi:MAG: putative metalloprotease CJM1_0395 family protein [Candidatus Poribacteria bacterium]|nr:putative metalloprotease CJM1_0395 family protein [Candidatus Poribacteria bacterium]